MWVNRDLSSLTQPLPAAQEQHPDPCSQGPLMLQVHHTTEPWAPGVNTLSKLGRG